MRTDKLQLLYDELQLIYDEVQDIKPFIGNNKKLLKKVCEAGEKIREVFGLHCYKLTLSLECDPFDATIPMLYAQIFTRLPTEEALKRENMVLDWYFNMSESFQNVFLFDIAREKE